MGNDPILRLQNINLHYGSSHVLHDVSLDLGDRPLGILGRNGVGKTSICNAIFGLAPITSGQIMLGNEDLSKLTPEKRAQAGLGYVPQGRRIFRSLTVEEHLRILERKGAAWNIERVYDTFPRLKERWRNLGDRLSGGEQQMLAISRALLLNPKVLVLDEPTEGLAPTIVSDVIELIKLVVREGTSVLLVEQNLHAALAAVEDVALIVG
ncbi:ABC transporter ATP-binding protein, partial [Planktotalea sp.]|uniref:ABC transporter ATP-binding protein n=1 Tax=Planktotalea sp. TaxID=2029877 RepID=UPI00329864BF